MKPLRNSLLATAVLLALAMGLNFFVAVKDHALHARHVETQVKLQEILRLKQEVESMLATSALERNVLRTTLFETVNAALESAIASVAELNLEAVLSSEIADLKSEHQKLQATQRAAVTQMVLGQWEEARQTLLDDAFVQANEVHELNIRAAAGTVGAAMVEQASLFDLLRFVTLVLQFVALALVLWVGARHALALRGEVLRQTRLQADLSISQQALRDLTSHEQAEREAGRKRVAQEIHDELGQRLTVLRMDVAMLPRAVQADPKGLLPGQVDALKGTIDAIVAVVRDIAGRLRPPALEVGLGAAARSLLDEFQQAMGIPCDLDDSLPSDLVLDDVRKTGIFRILQESMTNAARHAGASHIRVSLSVVGRGLRLTVQDDGRGFSGSRGGTFGVSGMRERAASFGGTLQISSEGGTGTTVQAWIPLDLELPAAVRAAG